MKFIFKSIILTASLLIINCAIAGNGKITITPIGTTLSKKEPIKSLIINNTTTQKLKFQIEINQWVKRKSDKIVKIYNHNIIFTPPIFTLPPNQKQIVRIGYKTTKWPEEELRYFFSLRQLQTTVPSKKNNVISFLYRFNTPLYIEPINQIKTISAKFIQSKNKKWNLQIKNDGNVHIDIEKAILNLGEKELAFYKKRLIIFPHDKKTLQINTSKDFDNTVDKNTKFVTMNLQIKNSEETKQFIPIIFAK